MNNYIQLISLVISFIYGILFFFLTKIHFDIVEDLKSVYKHFLTVLYTLDMIIIYALILYKINDGYFHIYFIVLVLLGFLIGYLYNVKISQIIVKLKNRH